MSRYVGIWYNGSKDGVFETAACLVRAIERAGAYPVMDGALCRRIGHEAACEDFAACEFLCVLGGDGTLLAALDVALPLGLPLLGVNMGRVGYLSEVQPENIERDVQRALSGESFIERRMLLEASTSAGERGLALNEVSFNRAEGTVGILALEMSAGGAVIDRLAGDGLVVATATGSTAYSLSAGGPVVAPGLDCVLLTPICSHTLHARPVVVSADQVVTVRVIDDRSRAHVLLDGRKPISLPEGDPRVTIRRAEATAAFLRLEDRNFFDVLREKLSDWTH